MADANSTQSQESPIHIDDVVAYFSSCSDVFGYLDSLFKAIEKESSGIGEIKKLAGAGKMLAADFESMADSWGEDIKRVGVRHD